MKKGLLLLGDIFILYSSLALTLWIRYGYLDQNLCNRHLLPFSIIFAIWLIVFFINGLYEFKKVRVDFSFYSIRHSLNISPFDLFSSYCDQVLLIALNLQASAQLPHLEHLS